MARDRLIKSELRRHGSDPRYCQMPLSPRSSSSQATRQSRETKDRARQPQNRLAVTIPEGPAEPVWEPSQVVKAGRTAEATDVAQDGGAATSEANAILMGARAPGLNPREVEDDKAAPCTQIEDSGATAGRVLGLYCRTGPLVWRVGLGRRLRDMMGSAVLNGAHDRGESQRRTVPGKSGAPA